MTSTWIRRLTGRSLLRDRHPHRRHRLADCPQCGRSLEGPGESWFDAEQALSEHMRTCRCDRPEPAREPAARTSLVGRRSA